MPKKKAPANKSGSKKSAKTKKAKRSPKANQITLRAPDFIPPGKEKRGPGRPSSYSQETAIKLCERLVNGESLRSICRGEEMPDAVTVFRWMDAHPDFRKQYVRAREMQAELLAEEIIEISDTPMMGVRKKMTPRGPEIVTGDMVERSRLRVDARKWAASRLLPKRYGDRPSDEGAKANDALQAMIDALNAGPVPPGEVNE